MIPAKSSESFSGIIELSSFPRKREFKYEMLHNLIKILFLDFSLWTEIMRPGIFVNFEEIKLKNKDI